LLNGISNIGLNYANYNLYNTAAVRNAGGAQSTVRAAAVPTAQPETPVQPVDPVRGAQEVALDKEGLLRRWENDPAAAIVRSRIQYPDDAKKADNGSAVNDAIPKEDGGKEKAKSAQEAMEDGECQTCKNRKYQDGSDDPGVSFKSPTSVAPEQAASAVRGHEYEHVVREQAEADREGREVVSQSVTYHNAICPECGRVYVAGGQTKTVTSNAAEPVSPEAADVPLPGEPAEDEE